MKSFSIISPTADIGLSVKGDNLDDLFKVALTGMNSILKKTVTYRGGKMLKSIKLVAVDTTALLIDFLSEILTYSLENKMLYKINFIKINNNALETKLIGYQIDRFDTEIKAVTYHEAEIKKNKHGNFATKIIFDI